MPDAKFWFGNIGILGACVLFASPIPTMKYVVKVGSVMQFSPDPYIMNAINCVVWVMWASVTPDRMAPLITNAIGTGVNVVYLFIFFWWGDTSSRSLFLKKIFAATLLIAATAAFSFMVAPLVFEKADADWKVESAALGVLADIFNVLMYAGPLTIAVTVIKTKSVEFMPLGLAVGTTFCSVTWFGYGIVVRDITIVIPNGLGVLLSVLQFLLYCRFCRSRQSQFAFQKLDKKLDTLDDKKSVIEMQDSTLEAGGENGDEEEGPILV